jgi:hypothetical protein
MNRGTYDCNTFISDSYFLQYVLIAEKHVVIATIEEEGETQSEACPVI